MKSKLLITGAGGIVGTGIRPYLEEQFDLRFSMRTASDDFEGCDVVLGDITDPEVIARAVEGCSAILHLAAAHGTGIDFDGTLDVNYLGLVALMDAAVAAGTTHVIFASSNHGWGMWPRHASPLAETAPPRPDGWYGVSKIFGEAVMAFYADTRGLRTTSLRIGNCGPAVEDERRQHMWISFADLAQLVNLSIARTDFGHRAVFATADCATPFFDNSGAVALGFETHDRPENNLLDATIAAHPPASGMHGAAIGGGYSEANFHANFDDWNKT